MVVVVVVVVCVTECVCVYIYMCVQVGSMYMCNKQALSWYWYLGGG